MCGSVACGGSGDLATEKLLQCYTESMGGDSACGTNAGNLARPTRVTVLFPHLGKFENCSLES